MWTPRIVEVEDDETLVPAAAVVIADSRESLQSSCSAQLGLGLWSRLAVIDEERVLFSNFDLATSLLASFRGIFDERERTLQQGVTIDDKDTFQVTSFHGNFQLLYGRRGAPSVSEGIAVCAAPMRSPPNVESAKRLFAIATYRLPVVSARAVPSLYKFACTL